MMIMITVLYAIFFIDTVLLWRSMVLTATEDFMWEILWDPDSFKLWLLASPELDVFPSLRQPAEDMFVSLTQPVEDLVTWAGPGIIAIWALLALSSSLRPKCDWVDAFGFWLGVGWILMVGKPVVRHYPALGAISAVREWPGSPKVENGRRRCGCPHVLRETSVTSDPLARKRAFHVGDAFILAAFTVMGIVSCRVFDRPAWSFLPGFGPRFYRTEMWHRVHGWLSFFLLSWTFAFIVLRWRKPRPPLAPALNIAFNILAGGKRMEHIELRRNDEVYLNALGAQRVPDPTTAGDFCRRFRESDIMDLMDAINQTRKRVSAEQPPEFFEEAIIDADGTLVETDAECKEGIDIAYDGTWGYHPLLISLANTAEPLYLVNRSGNRPSQEQADIFLDKAVDLCRGQASAKFCCGAIPSSRRPNIWTVGTTRATSASSSDTRPTTPSRPWQTPCRPRRTASWNDRPAMRFRPHHVNNPTGSRRRSSSGAGSRPFACSRRWSPSSTIASRVPTTLSRGRAPQATGNRPGADAAVRGVSLFLLHYQ